MFLSETHVLDYHFLLTKVFDGYGVELDEVESISAKESLDAKCLAQSNLKFNKEGILVQVEPSYMTSPSTAGPSNFGQTIMEDRFLDFVLETRENQRVIMRKLVEITKENKFWRDLIFGLNTPLTTKSGRFPTASWRYSY